MSPLYSQVSFAEHLAAKAYEKKLNVLMTSHSPTFLEVLGTESLRLLERRADGVHLTPGNPHPSYLAMLGIVSDIEIILAVEDATARDFAGFLLENFDPLMASKIEISSRGGESQITKLLKVLEIPLNSFRVIALFDGDQREKVSENYKDISTFLPGELPIERLYHDLVSKHSASFGERLKRPDVNAILASLEGLDIHDWFEELGKKLGMDRKQIGYILFSFWMEFEENRNAAKNCYDELVKCIRPPAHA